MEKLEITIEILETKELSTINTIIGNCGISEFELVAAPEACCCCCCSG